MANILDYLNWRGDITLKHDPFNEVDALILARLVYVPFDLIRLSKAEDSITIRDAATRLLALPDLSFRILNQDDKALLHALIHSDRFSNMTLSHYVNRIEKDTETQFAAITVSMNPKQCFVAFRGTDDTLVGWKENFNMSFTCPVPSQQIAVDYLETVASNSDGKLLAGGHSKGGNLAQYAAANCDKVIRNRIGNVYSFDGPGFDKSILSRPGFKKMHNRMFNYVPQSSIVGMLMDPAGKVIVVNSNGKRNFRQHDVYTWDLYRNHFIYLDAVTEESQRFSSTITSWLTEIDLNRREKVIDAVYAAIAEDETDSLKELDESRFRTAINVLSSINNMDKETRRMVTGTLAALVRHWRENRRLQEESSNDLQDLSDQAASPRQP